MGEGARGGAAACGTGKDGTRWAATRASLLSAASMARASAGVACGVARGVVVGFGTLVRYIGGSPSICVCSSDEVLFGKGPAWRFLPDKTCVLMGWPRGVPTVEFEFGSWGTKGL